MSSATILEINGITKRFGGLVAVDDLHFHVNEMEVIGLIGPNGSGKTTVMNLISGELKLTSGEIRMGNTVISDLPTHRIAQYGIARTFQLVKILPSLSVVDNVIAGGVFGHRKVWGEKARKEAYQLLERVGLAEQADSPTEELNYIDQKRLELARSLASDPKLLLLDEWLAGLNPTELHIGIDLINSLRDEGRTIILVEHVMNAIRSLCDRAVVMSSGVKIADGEVSAVLQDQEVIKAYLGDSDA